MGHGEWPIFFVLRHNWYVSFLPLAFYGVHGENSAKFRQKILGSNIFYSEEKNWGAAYNATMPSPESTYFSYKSFVLLFTLLQLKNGEL